MILTCQLYFQSQHFWVYDQNLENQLVQNSWYIWHDQMNSGKCDLLETTCWLFITRAGTSTHWIDQNQKLQIDTDSNNHHHHSKGTAIWLFVIRYYQLKCFVRSQIILVQVLVLETSTFCMMMLCFKMDVCRDQRWIQTCALSRVDVTQNRLMQSFLFDGVLFYCHWFECWW